MNPKTIVKPCVTEEMAKELALRVYGFTVVSIKQMVSYDDQNFHIRIANDHTNPHLQTVAEDGYTLKITNIMKSALPGHFDSMHSAMMHLSKKGLRVPLPIRNLEGKTWRLEELPTLMKEETSDTKPCGIHLLTFLPGVPLSTLSYTPNMLYQWGRLLAQTQDALEDFRHPTIESKEIFWNLEHVLELRSFLEGLDEDKTNLVINVLNAYPNEVTKNIDKVPKGVIHADFNENNILVTVKKLNASDEELRTVQGILDFEDMYRGTFVWDVGLMLGYSLLECETMDPLEGSGHVLAGYNSLRTLNDTEMSMLKICMACRLCQSLVLGAYCAREDPNNSYILVSSRRGWTRLEQLWNTPKADLFDIWDNVQDSYYNSNK